MTSPPYVTIEVIVAPTADDTGRNIPLNVIDQNIKSTETLSNERIFESKPL